MPGGGSARYGCFGAQVANVECMGQERAGLSMGYGCETYIWRVVWTNAGMRSKQEASLCQRFTWRVTAIWVGSLVHNDR
jgi:hypothetical protein